MDDPKEIRGATEVSGLSGRISFISLYISLLPHIAAFTILLDPYTSPIARHLHRKLNQDDRTSLRLPR